MDQEIWFRTTSHEGEQKEKVIMAEVTQKPAEIWEAEREKLNAEAEAARAKALADKAEAEHKLAQAREKAALAAEAEYEARKMQISLEQVEFAYKNELAKDVYHHVYQFNDRVDGGAVQNCISQLRTWMRNDPGCDIEIVFFSPGGSVIDGMALFDFIQELRRKGHKVTTVCTGYAASMAGILLQAGDVRSMSKESYILIHEVAFGAAGKIGEVEDEVTFAKKIQDRVVSIFAIRSLEAHQKNPEVCPKPLTAAQIRNRWRRKDWWLSSDEALKYGLVDEVR